MNSDFLQPCLTEPTRALGKSKPTFIDNIFRNTAGKPFFAGNFLDKVSDHLPNILIKALSLKEKNRRLKSWITPCIFISFHIFFTFRAKSSCNKQQYKVRKIYFIM